MYWHFLVGGHACGAGVRLTGRGSIRHGIRARNCGGCCTGIHLNLDGNRLRCFRDVGILLRVEIAEAHRRNVLPSGFERDDRLLEGLGAGYAAGVAGLKLHAWLVALPVGARGQAVHRHASEVALPGDVDLQGERIASRTAGGGGFTAQHKLTDGSGEVRGTTLQREGLDFHDCAIGVQRERFLGHLAKEVVEKRILEH